MGTWIISVEDDIETAFFRIIEKKFGPKENAIEPVLNKLMQEWVEKNKYDFPKPLI